VAKQFGLGKGLGALIPDSDLLAAIVDKPSASETRAGSKERAEGLTTLPISALRPNPEQPRRSFPPESLAELAASIKTHGLIQPIVAEATEGQQYIIVAGERRYRAAQIAGLVELPVLIRSFSPDKRLEVALIENVQREDLNPVEEAEAYRALMAMGARSQEEVADVVGKSRSSVANSVRLLKLPESVLAALRDGSISAGHAKALLAVVDPGRRDRLFARMIAEGISVREAEAAAQDLNSPAPGAGKATRRAETPKEPEMREVEERLIGALGTKVTVMGSAKKGRIAIEYYSLEDLERILDVLAR
jgi:ParB family chromosome partitioning protein